MPLIDEYYYCASDLIPAQWATDEKCVQTLPLSPDRCPCYGSPLCVWVYTCNASWPNVHFLWQRALLPCYHFSTRNIFPHLIPYLLVAVRLSPGSTVTLHEWYISRLVLPPKSLVPRPDCSAYHFHPRNTMPQFQTTHPPVRRIVTAHDTRGREIIRSDTFMPTKVDKASAKEPTQITHYLMS